MKAISLGCIFLLLLTAGCTDDGKVDENPGTNSIGTGQAAGSSPTSAQKAPEPESPNSGRQKRAQPRLD